MKHMMKKWLAMGMIAVFLLTGCGSTQEAADTENTPVTEENGEMVAPSPDKYLKITLRETDGNLFISAIQNTSAPEVAKNS